MRTAKMFVAAGLGLSLMAPACADRFASIGDDGGASSGGAESSSGAAVFGIGGSAFGGSGGAMMASGGSQACLVRVISIPVCSNASAVQQYDSSGCPAGYACPGEPGSCACSEPRPLVANAGCMDGSMGGPLCVAQTDGSCGWVIHDCPDSGGVYCTYDQIAYAAGTSFNATDGCNVCSCDATGQTTCTTRGCPVTGSGGSTSVLGLGGSTSVTGVGGSPPSTASGGDTSVIGLGGSTSVVGEGGSPPSEASGGSSVVGSGGQTGAVSCPAINLANVACSNYQPINDPTTACTIAVVCPQTLIASCPAIVQSTPACATGPAVLQYDATTGCATGYVCP